MALNYIKFDLLYNLLYLDAYLHILSPLSTLSAPRGQECLLYLFFFFPFKCIHLGLKKRQSGFKRTISNKAGRFKKHNSQPYRTIQYIEVQRLRDKADIVVINE